MEYVCTGATLKCTMGTSCPKLKATPKNISLTGKDQANIADYVSMKNIPSFGRCRSLSYPPTASATAANHGKLTPMPCVPGTCPKWKAIDKDSLICGLPALLKPATLKCMYGGTISIVDSGQTLEIKVRGIILQSSNEKQEKIEQEIPEALLQEFNELDTEGLNKDSILDGVQLALDAAGMVPVLGAVPDLINASISVLRGDWVGAGLSLVAAVPGVGDVVGGAKIAYKGAKIASKSIKVTNAKGVSKTAKGYGNNSQIKNAPSIKQNQPNASDDFNSDSFMNKERIQLREIRAKRAGVKPEEGHSEILYDSLSDSKNQPELLGLITKEKINSGTAKNEIPEFEINPDTPNIFIPSAEVKPINTNTLKDYEMTKEAMKNAEQKGVGEKLNFNSDEIPDFEIKHISSAEVYKPMTSKDFTPEKLEETMKAEKKELEETKKAKENAENKVLGKNLNIEG